MADIYFLKDGEGTLQCRPAMKMKLSEIVSVFGAASMKFLKETDIVISSKQPSVWDKRVIILVTETERYESPVLKAGFHVLDGIFMETFNKTISHRNNI